MLVTFDTSKLYKLIEINEEQPENIDSISLTREVSKLDKLIEFKEEH